MKYVKYFMEILQYVKYFMTKIIIHIAIQYLPVGTDSCYCNMDTYFLHAIPT